MELLCKIGHALWPVSSQVSSRFERAKALVLPCQDDEETRVR